MVTVDPFVGAVTAAVGLTVSLTLIVFDVSDLVLPATSVAVKVKG